MVFMRERPLLEQGVFLAHVVCVRAHSLYFYHNAAEGNMPA
jgi:hypothetical protein